MNHSNILEIKNFKKIYNNFSVEIEDFSLETGQVIGLIGENGAGKSTTLKSLLGIISYDYGKFIIDGTEMSDKNISIKERIGYVPENVEFYRDICGIDIASFLKNCYVNWDNNLFLQLAEKFKVDINKKLKKLSKGNLVKLFLILAVSHHPKLLILDEPTSGLDPIVRNQILNYLNHIVKKYNISILFSSHIMEDIEKLADKIAYMYNGKIILNEKKEKILRDYKTIEYNGKNLYLKENSIAKYENKFLIDFEKHKKFIEEENTKIESITLDKVLEFIVNNERNPNESFTY